MVKLETDEVMVVFLPPAWRPRRPSELWPLPTGGTVTTNDDKMGASTSHPRVDSSNAQCRLVMKVRVCGSLRSRSRRTAVWRALTSSGSELVSGLVCLGRLTTAVRGEGRDLVGGGWDARVLDASWGAGGAKKLAGMGGRGGHGIKRRRNGGQVEENWGVVLREAGHVREGAGERFARRSHR